jgi:hypothetical protein
MKLVPEYIDEAMSFQRGRDPLKTMDIGILNQKKHFPSVKKAMEWVADVIPLILGKDEMPSDIAYGGSKMIKGEYITKISKYVSEKISWGSDDSPSFDKNMNWPKWWDDELIDVLEERGFVNESVSFMRGEDPKKAMGIGMEALTFHVGSIKYNKGSIHWLDKEDARRVLRGEDTCFREYFLAVPGFNLNSGYYFYELLNPKNPYCYIEYADEIFPIPGKIHESLDFQRGLDTKTVLGIGEVNNAYPVEEVISYHGIMSGDSVDNYLRNIMPISLKGAILRGKSWHYPRFVQGGHHAPLDWILRQGYSGILYNGVFYPFPKIEGYSFSRHREEDEDLDESVSFERGQNPLKTMDIGILNQKKHFPSVKKAMEWVADILPLILGTPEIPENIIKSKNFINSRYLNKIHKYVEGKLSWNENIFPWEWDFELFDILKDRGFLFEGLSFQRGADSSAIKRSLRDPIPGDLFMMDQSKTWSNKMEIFIYIGPTKDKYRADKDEGKFWYFANISAYWRNQITYINHHKEILHNLRTLYISSFEPISVDVRYLLKQDSIDNSIQFTEAVNRMQKDIGEKIKPLL